MWGSIWFLKDIQRDCFSWLPGDHKIYRHKKHLSDEHDLIHSGNILFDSKGIKGNPSLMDILDKLRMSYMPVWKKKRSLGIKESGLTLHIEKSLIWPFVMNVQERVGDWRRFSDLDFRWVILASILACSRCTRKVLFLSLVMAELQTLFHQRQKSF